MNEVYQNDLPDISAKDLPEKPGGLFLEGTTGT